MMEFVNGLDDIPYMKSKIKAMFETTNQSIYWVTSRVRITIPKIGLLDSVLDYERPLFIDHIKNRDMWYVGSFWQMFFWMNIIRVLQFLDFENPLLLRISRSWIINIIENTQYIG